MTIPPNNSAAKKVETIREASMSKDVRQPKAPGHCKTIGSRLAGSDGEEILSLQERTDPMFPQRGRGG
jgi:hypothetical protein